MTTENTTPTAAAPSAARVRTESSSHWYSAAGVACYEVPKAKGDGMRKTTLADARTLNLLPSVTTILRILHKEALVQWLQEQSALAVLTAPRIDGEAIDAFVYRVLHTEKQQDQESQIARDKGTAIHAALEDYFNGRPVPDDLETWVRPAINALIGYGERASSEVILVGEGYAGKTDLIQDCGEFWRIWDAKSAKKLPDPNKGGAWSDHKLQLAAYARAWANKIAQDPKANKPVICANIYISTVTPGEYVVCEHENWEQTYEQGFKPLVGHWQWSNQYWPVNPNAPKATPPTSTPQRGLNDLIVEDELIQANQVIASLESKLAKLTGPASTSTVIAPAKPSLPSTTADGRKLQWSVAQASTINQQKP